MALCLMELDWIYKENQLIHDLLLLLCSVSLTIVSAKFKASGSITAIVKKCLRVGSKLFCSSLKDIIDRNRVKDNIMTSFD